MQKIEKVMLLDTRDLIAKKGVEVETWCEEAIFEVRGYELAHLAQLFGVDVRENTPIHGLVDLTAETMRLHVYPGEFIRWSPADVEGEVADGVLHLMLTWEGGLWERITYNGKFMIWWDEEDGKEEEKANPKHV